MTEGLVNQGEDTNRFRSLAEHLVVRSEFESDKSFRIAIKFFRHSQGEAIDRIAVERFDFKFLDFGSHAPMQDSPVKHRSLCDPAALPGTRQLLLRQSPEPSSEPVINPDHFVHHRGQAVQQRGGPSGRGPIPSINHANDRPEFMSEREFPLTRIVFDAFKRGLHAIEIERHAVHNKVFGQHNYVAQPM